MSTEVWKYPLPIADWCEHSVPVGAKVLHIAAQDDVPCVWMEVEPETPHSETKRFRTYGTGHRMDNVAQTYLGTYLLVNDAMVFHVYEQKAER